MPTNPSTPHAKLVGELQKHILASDQLHPEFHDCLLNTHQALCQLIGENAGLKARAVPTLEPQHIELVMKEMRVSGTVNVIRWWRAFQNAINAVQTEPGEK